MNLQSIMKQAQTMQRDIRKKKEELSKKQFTGSSELVDAVFSGDKKIVSVKIKGDISGDDKEIIEDMFVIAVNDALAQIDKASDEALGAYGDQLKGIF